MEQQYGYVFRGYHTVVIISADISGLSQVECRYQPLIHHAGRYENSHVITVFHTIELDRRIIWTMLKVTCKMAEVLIIHVYSQCQLTLPVLEMPSG